MAYILPRAIIVLIGFAITSALILRTWPHVNPMILYFAAVSWALAGIALFGYAYRLRCEVREQRAGISGSMGLPR